MLFSIFITAYLRRSTVEQLTFYNIDGEIPELAASDKVRIKIGRSDGSPLIDLVGGTPLSTDGTNVTNTNPATFTIVGTDFASLKPGVYDIEAMIVDSGDTNKTKMADEGVFVLIGTQGGNLGQP